MNTYIIYCIKKHLPVVASSYLYECKHIIILYLKMLYFCYISLVILHFNNKYFYEYEYTIS